MPLLRLQYNGDNQYTTKDKRNLLLTQEVIEKINNMSPSQGGGSQFVTQAEYDALPASKTSDGNLYIVVDSHISFVSFDQLLDMTVEEALAILNQYPLEYAQHYDESGDAYYEELEMPEGYEQYYVGIYGFNYDWSTNFNFVETDLTTQDLIDMGMDQEMAAQYTSGLWFTSENLN